MKRLEELDAWELFIEDIYYDELFNCRGQFTPQSCVELAEDIRQFGQDTPIVVQPAEDVEGGIPPGYKWRLIAGHRRYISVRYLLKWLTIKAVIRKGLTEREARRVNFAENDKRKNLNILEEARWLGKYIPEGMSLRDAAKEVNKDTRWVHVRLRLLKLPEVIQEMAAAEQLSKVDIETIASLETEALQLKAANDIQKAKRYGKSREVGTRYGRKFRYRRTKAEISKMVAWMLSVGLDDTAPRSLAWCAGRISDDDLKADILEKLQSQRDNPLAFTY